MNSTRQKLLLLACLFCFAYQQATQAMETKPADESIIIEQPEDLSASEMVLNVGSVNDIEKIGDYAEDIARIALILFVIVAAIFRWLGVL